MDIHKCLLSKHSAVTDSTVTLGFKPPNTTMGVNYRRPHPFVLLPPFSLVEFIKKEKHRKMVHNVYYFHVFLTLKIHGFALLGSFSDSREVPVFHVRSEFQSRHVGSAAAFARGPLSLLSLHFLTEFKEHRL